MLTEYLEAAKSAYHVVAFSASRLEDAGFEKIDISETVNLKRGGKYYCCPYPTALFAFRISDEARDGKGRMHIACAHTDSPCFKLKPSAEMPDRAGLKRVNMEPYGGMLKRTWFDRPLGIAGAVVLKGEDAFHPRRVVFDSGNPWFIIPSLAPHMDREIEERKLDVQKELMPIYMTSSEECSFDLLTAIAMHIGENPGDILDYDMNLYCTEKPTYCGMDGELLLASRIDNVASVAALVDGIIGAEMSGAEITDWDGEDVTVPNFNERDDNEISLIALFDNEEIGSRTKQGADSMLLSMVIDRIYESELFKNTSKLSALMGSRMLSVDGAHGVHPNYPEKADETARAVLGGGIVLKTSASQRYVTDVTMMGIVTDICDKCDIPVQKQANRSGTPGGQTLGPIESSYLPIPAADMGIPMLAMHSIMETMCLRDYKALLKFMYIWNRV